MFPFSGSMFGNSEPTGFGIRSPAFPPCSSHAPKPMIMRSASAHPNSIYTSRNTVHNGQYASSNQYASQPGIQSATLYHTGGVQTGLQQPQMQPSTSAHLRMQQRADKVVDPNSMHGTHETLGAPSTGGASALTAGGGGGGMSLQVPGSVAPGSGVSMQGPTLGMSATGGAYTSTTTQQASGVQRSCSVGPRLLNVSPPSIAVNFFGSSPTTDGGPHRSPTPGFGGAEGPNPGFSTMNRSVSSLQRSPMNITMLRSPRPMFAGSNTAGGVFSPPSAKFGSGFDVKPYNDSTTARRPQTARVPTNGNASSVDVLTNSQANSSSRVVFQPLCMPDIHLPRRIKSLKDQISRDTTDTTVRTDRVAELHAISEDKAALKKRLTVSVQSLLDRISLLQREYRTLDIDSTQLGNEIRQIESKLAKKKEEGEGFLKSIRDGVEKQVRSMEIPAVQKRIKELKPKIDEAYRGGKKRDDMIQSNIEGVREETVKGEAKRNQEIDRIEDAIDGETQRRDEQLQRRDDDMVARNNVKTICERERKKLENASKEKAEAYKKLYTVGKKVTEKNRENANLEREIQQAELDLKQQEEAFAKALHRKDNIADEVANIDAECTQVQEQIGEQHRVLRDLVKEIITSEKANAAYVSRITTQQESSNPSANSLTGRLTRAFGSVITGSVNNFANSEANRGSAFTDQKMSVLESQLHRLKLGELIENYTGPKKEKVESGNIVVHAPADDEWWSKCQQVISDKENDAAPSPSTDGGSISVTDARCTTADARMTTNSDARMTTNLDARNSAFPNLRGEQGQLILKLLYNAFEEEHAAADGVQECVSATKKAFEFLPTHQRRTVVAEAN